MQVEISWGAASREASTETDIDLDPGVFWATTPIMTDRARGPDLWVET